VAPDKPPQWPTVAAISVLSSACGLSVLSHSPTPGGGQEGRICSACLQLRRDPVKGNATVSEGG
jgi:hypothetical protein